MFLRPRWDRDTMSRPCAAIGAVWRPSEDMARLLVRGWRFGIYRARERSVHLVVMNLTFSKYYLLYASHFTPLPLSPAR